MTEYLHKDASFISEPGRVADSNSTETITERTLERESNAHALNTQPPANFQPTNVASESGTGAAVARAQEGEKVALFVANESNELRARWDSIQVGFVDEPPKAVEEADALVSATIARLAEMFAAERQKLEHQWDRSEAVSTEDLRLALRRYRSFFARLLAV